MLKKIKKVLTSKQGVSLLETLIALTILTIIAFCFLPLFSQYMNHIKTAGKLQQETQYKISLMERLIANKGDNPAGYEVGAGQIPLTFYCGGEEVSFNTNSANTIKGTVIQSDDSDEASAKNNYVTFAANSASARMYSFPNVLTDDFIEKDIYVVAKGFKFAAEAFDKDRASNEWHFAVAYTDSDGTVKTLDTEYYDITSINDNGELVAKFTFYGGNEYVSFEKSPFIIGYGTGASVSNLQYTTTVQVGAPQIIFVGEKASDNNYYYYATAGVNEDGEMDIIAKKMSGAPLTSAMNDVEWVEAGRGDNGNGGVNEYGYYVMGGDAGQVRRFWRNETTGNYYWGGDRLNNYDRRYDIVDGGSYENFDKGVTTQAMFKSIYRGKDDADFMHTRANNGRGDLNQYQYSVFVQAQTDLLGHKYQAATMNNFTANVTSSDTIALTMSGAAKATFNEKDWLGRPTGKVYYDFDYYGVDTSKGDSADKYKAIVGWMDSSSAGGSKLNVQGYKDATEYEYPNDPSLITITSVGAVQINKENSNYYGFQSDSFMRENGNPISKNIYPTQSYTLYCGYIPFVTDLYGWKCANAGGWSRYVHLGTLGVAYSERDNTWYPTGKFGDLYTRANSLSKDIFPHTNYQTLLNYYDGGNKFDKNTVTGTHKDTIYPYNWDKGQVINYKPGETVNGRYVLGQALSAQGQDYYVTGGHEVDVTTGYLSEPYAISAYNPIAPDVSGADSASNFYHTFNGVGDFGHSYTGAGLRENVTLLDVKSFYDDLNGNNISFAVGYSLSFLCNDYAWSTRLGQVYNTGIVYIRALGAGTDDDRPEYAEHISKASGRGWSMKKETNIFHQFYGIDQYQDGQPNGKTGITANGWDTYWHRNYFNISSDKDKAPQSGKSPSLEQGNDRYGTSCHPLADTKCTTVNKGVTWDEKPEIMWGTENGTLIGWTYDYENPTNSKITAVRKEFESYMWADRIGTSLPINKNSEDVRKNFYDYTSVSIGKKDTYGFISVLKSIKDVAYGDGFWVAVGDQSGRAPKDYCASDKCYTDGGGVGSYINVKYETGETRKVSITSGGKTVEVDAPVTAWKAVKVSKEKNINFVSVTYSQGVWYAFGYMDENHDGENNFNEKAYVYYSRNPAEGWELAQTRNANDDYTDTTNAILFDVAEGKKRDVEITGLNSTASRG